MSATAGVKTGVASRLYYNTGTYASPTWTNVALVKDVSPSLPWEKAEAGSRESRAKMYVKTRADLSIDVTMRSDNANTPYNAFRTAACAPGTVVDVLCLDGALADEGAHGYRGEFLVECTAAPQEIDGSIYDTFHLIPTWTSNGYPSTVVMGAASSPTITAL